MTGQEVFWSTVDKSGDCWPRGKSTHGGYTQFRNRPAHRYSYELAYGPIPAGLFVCHRCDNPPCVRPTHLFLGTANDNTQDAKAKGHFRYTPLYPNRSPAQLATALTQANGSPTKAAALLGISRMTLWRRMQKYGIEVKRIVAA